jgi:hypothetical protein
MQCSRLFLALIVVAACSSSSSKNPDANGNGGDAKVFLDGAPADAPNAAATGLGAVCDQTHMCPATGATQCAALSMTATHGFCTLSCGQTPSTATQPPANGDTMCAASTPASPDGKPLCAIHGPAMNNKFTWYCVLGCGTLNGMNLGQCPGGLACMNNVCQ